MKVQPTIVAGVELLAPNSPVFVQAVESLLGRELDDVIKPALPYSVIAQTMTRAPLRCSA